MKKHLQWVNVVVVIAAAIFVLLITQTSFFGVPGRTLVEDARRSSHISDDWLVVSDITEDLGAILFYSEDKENLSFSIYTDFSPVPLGYRFTYGGSLFSINDHTLALIYSDHGTVLLSMNRDRAVKIEYDIDGETQVYSVNPDQPFAVIIPWADSSMESHLAIIDEDGTALPVQIEICA